MTDYIKLKAAPTLIIHDPTCSACGVEVDCEDGWLCPVCGTSWEISACDGEEGALFEAWSGKELSTDALDSDEAFEAGLAHERAKSGAQWWLNS